MKIREKDFFHGAALTQIVEHPSFKALNKADEKYGHYQINNDIKILLKYRTHNKSPWIFTLNRNDLATLNKDKDNGKKIKSYLCLVCGNTTICILPSSDYTKLVKTSVKKPQQITVELPKNSSLHVRSKSGELDHCIFHNSFPKILFPVRSKKAK